MDRRAQMLEKAAKELYHRRRARSSIEDFVTYTKPDYEVNWHHHELCRVIDDFVAGRLRRVMVFMPPRSGKSEIVSRRLPAYLFGVNPNANLIACSYNASLACEMNRDVQRIIDSEEYHRVFPNSMLYGQNVRTMSQGKYIRNSDAFEIVGYTGRYNCAGVGGGITGRGFTHGIIDDPIKSRAEAESSTIREMHWGWYLSDFFTRRQNDASCILITLTRWNEDDLAGRLQKQAKENPHLPKWEVIRFPALAEEGDKDFPRDARDKRAVNEPLWGNRFSKASLEEIRDVSGAYVWASVYQQRPAPASGVLFQREHFHYFSEETVEVLDRRTGQKRRVLAFSLPHAKDGPPRRFLAEQCRYFQVVDTATSESAGAKYTAVGTFVLTPEYDLLVYEVQRAKIPWPKQYDMLMKQRERFPQLLFQGIENKSSGQGLIQQGAAQGKPFKELKPWADKGARAGTVVLMYEQDKVYHKSGAEWLTTFEDELITFPNGTYTDQGDVLAYAGWLATEDAILRRPFEGELFMHPRAADLQPETIVVAGHRIRVDADDDEWWRK